MRASFTEKKKCDFLFHPFFGFASIAKTFFFYHLCVFGFHEKRVIIFPFDVRQSPAHFKKSREVEKRFFSF